MIDTIVQLEPSPADTIGPLMQIFEVLTQNLFEPATVDDLVAITELDREFVAGAMAALRDLGYCRETKLGFQSSDIKVAKFDWECPVYDKYIRENYGKAVPFRGPDGEWKQGL